METPSVVNRGYFTISLSSKRSVNGIVCLRLFLLASRCMGSSDFFSFFYCAVQKSDLTHSPFNFSSFGSSFLLVLWGPGFRPSRLSQLHLGNQHTHFILVKISLNRFIADCCSCNQCLQSDDKMEIKACHHYLINLKLSSFWSHFMPFHKPKRAAKTVPGVLIDSRSHSEKQGWLSWDTEELQYLIPTHMPEGRNELFKSVWKGRREKGGRFSQFKEALVCELQRCWARKHSRVRKKLCS